MQAKCETCAKQGIDREAKITNFRNQHLCRHCYDNKIDVDIRARELEAENTKLRAELEDWKNRAGRVTTTA